MRRPVKNIADRCINPGGRDDEAIQSIGSSNDKIIAERFFMPFDRRHGRQNWGWHGTSPPSADQFCPPQVNSKIAVKTKATAMVNQIRSRGNLFRAASENASQWRQPVPSAKKWMTAVSLHASISAAHTAGERGGRKRFFLPSAPAGQNQSECRRHKQGFMDEITAVINWQRSEGEQQRGDEAGMKPNISTPRRTAKPWRCR